MAVHSIGVDITEIERINDLINRYGNRFLKRVFTDKEIEYCNKKATAASSYAARFATKEAVFKATGLGLNQGMSWRDIEVLNDQNGKPFIKLSGITKEKLNSKKIHLSLSHSKGHAISMVVVDE